MPKAKRTIRIAILVVAVCLAGFVALQVLTPLEPRAQHTVRLCVDRPPVATKLFRSQQFLSGGEVVAVFNPTDFGLDLGVERAAGVGRGRQGRRALLRSPG